MIYPHNFESKIGFTEVRSLLKSQCLSTLGKDKVDSMSFSDRRDDVRRLLEQTRELRNIRNEQVELPLEYIFDCRVALKRIRVENTHLEEDELFDLRRSMGTIEKLTKMLNTPEDDGNDNDGWQRENSYPYPALHELAEDVLTFPQITARIDQVIDKTGNVRDTASPELQSIRRELASMSGSISRKLNSILHSAQSEGVVDKDVAPTMRDGRLVIPVSPGLKRKIRGIVHDESATGKTVFIEPAEVVEANNRVRELESEERHEIIRILTELTNVIRPHTRDILLGYDFLGEIDFVQARASMAERMKAFEPEISESPVIDWIHARHPLLQIHLEEEENHDSESPAEIVPLDITLTPEKHILIISGPNAGGKSVCLKTVGLLQYMLQCGLSIPVGDRSRCGLFADIMIDIGDEQSLENDLSTYSSHLLNMKNMMKQANPRTLILIDEFGTGTEPQIGGAIAESVLEQLCRKGTWGVITTHYQNLKHFADTHEGVVNGAMLYDRHEMRPLFQLAIGQPGSSFAIDIARKIGLPAEVINQASEIVGSDYIQSDKYLQDIVRDKRYWENKRQTIHQREKDLEKTIGNYESGLQEVEQQRKQILAKAKEEAQSLLAESNKRIENAIREIRESQAEKEETKRIRKELKEFESGVDEIDSKANDDAIARKIEQIQRRKERHEKRRKERKSQEESAAAKLREAASKPKNEPIETGKTVRIKGTRSQGVVERIDGDMATVVFGGMRTTTRLNRLEAVSQEEQKAQTPELTRQERLAESLRSTPYSRVTQDTVDEHRKNFHQDIDVRGMRGDEALREVGRFIDDAILMGMPRVRILHGKGNGILRQLIRQYLSTVPNVTNYADERVQFGGAGITVVDL